MTKALRQVTRKEKKAGKNLKAIRLELKLPQEAIAEILGCTQSYISAMENGRQAFRPALARVLITGLKKKYKKIVSPQDFGLID